MKRLGDAAKSDTRPPEFENYVVVRVLGEGGMGIVYLGHDVRADLPVAIKVMSKRLADPVIQRRFLQENAILSELNHRNIVRCFEIVRTRDGVPSIVMEYLDGVDFRAFEGRPYPELLPLMIQTVMGLKYLKSRNILHRDLSSNNIVVTLENQKRLVKILDFGVAKVLGGEPRVGDVQTLTGQFLGKFSFSAPELFFSKAIDWRSDIYSLGVVFHRLLTGKAPIKVERPNNYYEWVVAHRLERTFPVETPPGMPELPEPLRKVVRRMLAKRPEDRPQDYDELIDELDAIQRKVLEDGLEPDSSTVSNLPLPVIGSMEGAPSPPQRGTPAAPDPRPQVTEDTPFLTPPPPPESVLPTTERGERAPLTWLEDSGRSARKGTDDVLDTTEKVVVPPELAGPDAATIRVPPSDAPTAPPPKRTGEVRADPKPASEKRAAPEPPPSLPQAARAPVVPGAGRPVTGAPVRPRGTPSPPSLPRVVYGQPETATERDEVQPEELARSARKSLRRVAVIIALGTVVLFALLLFLLSSLLKGTRGQRGALTPAEAARVALTSGPPSASPPPSSPVPGYATSSG